MPLFVKGMFYEFRYLNMAGRTQMGERDGNSKGKRGKMR
jgi:hypothetical protein